MTTHELKTWPEYFSALWDGTKKFEFRKNDRGFKVGDVLWLREYDPFLKIYTKREIYKKVLYILYGDSRIDLFPEYCIMSIE